MSIVITLPGADKLLDTSRSIEQAAIDGDAEEEIECYNSVIEAERSMAPELLSLGDDVSHPLLEPTSPDQTSLKKAKTEGKVDPELVERLVKEKSRNVVVTHTQEEYARLWKQFTTFCVSIGFIEQPSDIESSAPDFNPELPKWITYWIMDKCDDTDIRTGKLKDPSIPRPGIGTAQKMRSAMTHMFGREYGRGTQYWTENPLQPGKWFGNPSLSVTVMQYMVRAGEAATSARAIDEATMKLLFDYLRAFPIMNALESVPRKRKADEPELWSGHRIRAMLHLLFVVSLLCLLRSDEGLRIMWSNVTFETTSKGKRRIKLMLPFRKNRQDGGVQIQQRLWYE
ncbi:hypothetical protein NLI96_g9183 [Meripilus lineatus]|uniref:Uncharacterized protein n=1 Tax=Meripilus lineatus TaxID=2056292 RepID=A0AAD5YFG3_9APHY|nr:hypothetical protein NLI96_g9183 [Physisporinus lineatus]